MRTVSVDWDRRADRYGVKAPEAERDLALSSILEHHAWIIEGAYYQWVSRSFEDADKIIVLTPSVWTRDWRILKRFLTRKLGLIQSKKESLRDLRELLAWNHGYDSGPLQRARASIQHLRVKTIECKTANDVLRALEI